MPRSTRGKPTAGGKRRAAPTKTAASSPKHRTGPRYAARKRTRDASLNKSNIIAFLATADGARARTFYQTVVGLPLIADDPFALVLDANGVMVRIQKVDAVTPAAYTTLGWQVRDTAATVRHLGAKGVQFERMEPTRQRSRRIRPGRAPERVRAGEQLMDGPSNPQDIPRVLGEKELQKYLVNEIQEVYSGYTAHHTTATFTL